MQNVSLYLCTYSDLINRRKLKCMLLVKNSHTDFNSLLATYLMGCKKATEQMSHHIRSLCWVDKDILIVAASIGNTSHLVKYNVNITANTCEGQLIESVDYVSSVSCSEGGKLFVSANKGANVKILIYDVKTGQKHPWNTGISRNGGVYIAENRDFIVLSVGNENYIFNADRVLLYKLTYDVDFSYFLQTYVTNTAIFFGMTFPTHIILELNLLTNKTTICKKGINKALGVSGTRNGYVYVTDLDTEDVGVYLPDGTFLNTLQIEAPPGGGNLFYIGAFKIRDDEDLIACSTWNDNIPIAIYKVTNQNIFEQ